MSIKSKQCCCVNQRLCIAFTLVSLLLLGVLVYFLYPSAPQLSIGDPFIPISPDSFSFSGDGLLPIAGGGAFSLKMVVNSNISVYLPSFINVGIRKVDAVVQIKGLDGSIISNYVAEGSKSDLIFVARSSTEFIFPTLGTYNSSVFTLTNDPFLSILRTKCLANPPQKLQGRINVKLDVSALSWLGIHPQTTVDNEISCPNESQSSAIRSVGL